MTHYEIIESVKWLLTTVKEHNGNLPLTIDFLISFKSVFDIAYESTNKKQFKKCLIELKIKNVDAVIFAIVKHKLVPFRI